MITGLLPRGALVRPAATATSRRHARTPGGCGRRGTRHHARRRAPALEDEIKHFKFIGTTGTGKSTAIHEVLEAALRRGDRAVIADPDGGYLRRFYDPGAAM